MGLLGEQLHGAIKPEEIAKALQPLLKEFQANVAAAISTGLHSGLDRLNGAKIIVTIELPPPKATPA